MICAYLPSANEVWGKVICLQAFVCPQGAGACSRGGVCSGRGCLLQGGGGCLLLGVSAPSGGCLLPGGVCLRGGVGGSAPGGGCAWWRPPKATAAGGTHPTGMHSCYFCKAKKYADVMVNVDISKIFILKAIWAKKQFT